MTARYFFVGVGAYCILLTVVGFGPNLYKGLTGELFIPAQVHVHGAIMMGWLVLYTMQAGLVARGMGTRHRQIGWGLTALAAAVLISMGVVIIGALERLDPDTFGFIVQPILVGIATMVVFTGFFASAVLARREAGWHKRLMTFATFVLVQAALDRMHWLPDEGLPMFWHAGLRLYVLLLLPVFVFDFVTLRRIHPATLTGAGVIVAMHGVISVYWADAGWIQFARGFWMWVRST